MIGQRGRRTKLVAAVLILGALLAGLWLAGVVHGAPDPEKAAPVGHGESPTFQIQQSHWVICVCGLVAIALVAADAARHHVFARRCGWYGSHWGQITVAVDIAWLCGHSKGLKTPTCTAHLDHLLSQGGTASKAVPCPVCGTLGAARVVGTHDINPMP